MMAWANCRNGIKKINVDFAKGNLVALTLEREWPDEQGTVLGKTSGKNFIATVRDTCLPVPAKWDLEIPKQGTLQALEAELHEPLDYFLLQNTISIVDSDGNIIDGAAVTADNERKHIFNPAKRWSHGTYKLRVESRLEDLAGNNLDRPFDRDLQSNEPVSSKKVFENEWKVK